MLHCLGEQSGIVALAPREHACRGRVNPEVQEEAGPPARGTSRRAGNLAESLQIKGNLRS